VGIFYFIFLYFFKATLAADQASRIETLSWGPGLLRAIRMKQNPHGGEESGHGGVRQAPRFTSSVNIDPN